MIMQKSTSLADQVFDRLEQDILTGTYPRGTVLTETRLCEELGVSRTPIREALRRLEQEHIIETHSKGLVVLGITPQDAKFIYEIRTRIEGLAAAACAQRITDEQLKEISDIIDLQQFYADKQDSEKVKVYDSMFHEAVYKYSGSTVLYDTLVPLHRKIQKFRKVSVESGGRAHDSTAEHRKVYEALLTHDPVLAEKAMLAHVQQAQLHLTAALERES